MKKTRWIGVGIVMLGVVACTQTDPSGPGEAEAGKGRNGLAMAASSGDRWDVHGNWCVTQGSYTGQLTLNQNNSPEFTGTMNWYNHADASVEGAAYSNDGGDTLYMTFTYSPTHQGGYWAVPQGSGLAGTTWDISNPGNYASWSAVYGLCP